MAIFLVKVSYVSISNGNFSGAKKLFEQMQKFFEKLFDISADNNVSGISRNKVHPVSSENIVNNTDKLINTAQSSLAKTSGSSDMSYSRIFDELQEMIQLMMQHMLNEIIGIDRLGETKGSDGNTTTNAKVTEKPISEELIPEYSAPEFTENTADEFTENVSDEITQNAENARIISEPVTKDAENAGITPEPVTTDTEDAVLTGDSIEESLHLENAKEL